MKSFIFSNDVHEMNWVEGSTEWGTVKCPKELDVKTESVRNGDIVTERYTFTNITDKEYFSSLQDISIYTTFNDDYKDSATCITNRCHTHIWCGENITYVMALRMGGEAPHCGLVLTKGSIGGYSVERDFSKMSNDRGDFLFHPSPVQLSPNESFTIEWVLFPHDGKEDFYKKLSQYKQDFIYVSAQKYVLFEGEEINISIIPSGDISKENTEITLAGKKVEYNIDGEKIIINAKAETIGENKYCININGVKTSITILVHPEFSELVKRRCHFIAEKQQFHKDGSHMDGAFLIYDNEEKHMHYTSGYDHNCARERIGMALLLCEYLKNNNDEDIEKALKKYYEFAVRELFDSESGMVFNDYMRDNHYFRLYNYPWMSLYFLEMYCLYENKEYLINSYKVMHSFYEQGGAHFYAIEIPVDRLLKALEKENMSDEKNELTEHFKRHCDFIISNGLEYPAHEVNYEQSISAPAADTLLKMYMASGEQKYLDGGMIQLHGLEMFNGIQPDYHMYEVAIRHWDGYWFGKKRLYGDTYPHYWSSLTGNVYLHTAQITGSDKYLKKADASFRGTMSMFNADGSASCAFVYPVSVNGIKAHFADPYANDQDWGMYFMLRYVNGQNK